MTATTRVYGKPSLKRLARPLRLIVVPCGVAAIAVAFLLPSADDGSGLLSPLRLLLAGVGVGVIVFGVLLPRLSEVFVKLAMALVVGVVFLAVAEVACRLARVDFRGTRRAWANTPICYRQPIEPVGAVFFRRPGPDRWTGKVLGPGLVLNGFEERNAYHDEEAVAITYDDLGFRNPPELTDWEIVVAGDSFTELGHLQYEDLWTTRLGEALGLRVKNLGVSYTATRSQTFYLREYGKAPSATDAIVAFFEGNDLGEGREEKEALDQLRATGQRPYRDLLGRRQSSPLLALGDLADRLRAPLPKKKAVNSVFLSGKTEIPATMDYTPPNRSALDDRTRDALEEALADWRKAAEDHGLRPWLVYLPCKRRVCEGCVRFLDPESPKATWRPSDLPEYVAEVCRKNAIRFVDVTPRLAAEAKRGVLPYNAVWDTHFNRRGSAIVAEALVEALRGKVGKGR